ncbi:MAG: hypothetical protein RIM72_06860 [Alphaproteobacteria bacterium]
MTLFGVELLTIVPLVAFFPAYYVWQRKLVGRNGGGLWRAFPGYLSKGIVVGATYFLPIAIVSTFSWSIRPIDNLPEFAFSLLFAHLVGLYLASRFALVLPSIASGDPMSFGESWAWSGDLGWRNFIVVLFVTTPVVVGIIGALAYLYMPAIAGLSGSSQELGRLIVDGMIKATFVVPPILFCLGLVFSTYAALAFKQTTSDLS